MAEVTVPRVFVSYSWTTDEHVDWVVGLAQRLKSNGVDVILDQWHLKHGHDKYAFMEKMVTDPTVTRVLCICDKAYAEKANARKGGVGTESQIISKEIYEKVEQEKFLPLVRVRDADGKEYVPVFFGSRIYLDFSNDDDFERSYDILLRNLFEKPSRAEPPLGQPPAYILQDDPPPGILVEFARVKDAILKERGNALAMLDDYFESFVNSMEDFRIEVTNDPAFDEEIINSIGRFTAYRDSFIDVIVLLGQHYAESESAIERVASFFERLYPFIEIPAVSGGHRDDEVDNYRFFLYELVVYAIAGLIKTRAYWAAAHLMEREYVMKYRINDTRVMSGSIGSFNLYMEGLEERRQRRLNSNRITVAGDLMIERATHQRLSREEIMQADFVLFVHGAFGTGRSLAWAPRVCLLSSGTFDLFARALTPSGGAAVETILGIQSVRDIVTRLRDGMTMHLLVRMVGNRFLRQFSIPTAINLEEIERRTG